jgi:hypothetical protein
MLPCGMSFFDKTDLMVIFRIILSSAIAMLAASLLLLLVDYIFFGFFA